MPKLVPWSPALAALLSVLALARPTPAVAQTSTMVQVPKLSLTDFTLPNGLRVLLHEDHSSPIVAVDLWYNAGSKFDPKGKTGLAHMFVLATTTHKAPQRVKAGDVLGYLGPATQKVCALRFTLMRNDGAGHFHSINPMDAMTSWAVLPWADDRTTPPAIQPLAA